MQEMGSVAAVDGWSAASRDFAEISVGGKLCRGKNVDSPICHTTLEHLDIIDRYIWCDKALLISQMAQEIMSRGDGLAVKRRGDDSWGALGRQEQNFNTLNTRFDLIPIQDSTKTIGFEISN
jgi:hypothetical protein